MPQDAGLRNARDESRRRGPAGRSLDGTGAAKQSLPWSSPALQKYTDVVNIYFVSTYVRKISMSETIHSEKHKFCEIFTPEIFTPEIFTRENVHSENNNFLEIFTSEPFTPEIFHSGK